ncbi:putative aldouronate transport system substrate-binding protein [Paenibacillus castaneae]|uniref:extracellular solute-binding protein n=1 Tax=Paenibacillus castaneae TaxID=474957 RepID=UPI000C99DFAF|nr:extracellular solute-binding protein [Paenibacillus castaneae]NIK75263.1 putative aldouronate transport system substrate-binding protein [Paenibacillus castaneae]
MQGNRKKMNKMASLLMVGALVASTLIGCSQTNNEKNNPTPGAATPEAAAPTNEAVKEEAPLKLNIMLPIFKTNYPKDDSPVAAELEKRTNTDIHFEWVPNASYTDKFNITLASGKLPTIMYVPDVKSPSFVNAAKSGAFWELGSYLKDYPNLSGANPVILNNSSIDGKNYGIYRGRALGRNGVYYRKDWLDKVGLPVPETIDDFYNMLKAFKEQDPDNNGKADTYGMVLVKWTGQWSSGFDNIKLWFGAPNKWGDVDGSLVPDHLTAEYLEALKFMKKLYDEKLINQDFAIMDSAKWTDPLVNNQAGVIIDVVDGAARVDDKIHAALVAEGKDQPGVHFMDVFSGVKGPDGQLHTLPTSGFAGMLAVPKSAVKTEEELKRVLTFIDQINQPELQTMLGYGLEGTHHTVEEGSVVVSKDTVLMESEVEGLNQMLTFIPEDLVMKVKQTPLRLRQAELQKENESYIVANPAEPFISKVYTEKGAQLDNILNDARIKFIVGQLDEAGFNAALELWKKSGGNDLIKEMNELYAASK